MRSEFLAPHHPRASRGRMAVLVPLLASALAIAIPSHALAQVAARDLPRNSVLTANDIMVDTGASASPVGWITRRTIRLGEPLAAPAIAPPRVVRRGATITIVHDDGTVRVSRRAVALCDAAVDEPCRVRVRGHEDSRPRLLSGRVVAPGVVAIERPH